MRAGWFKLATLVQYVPLPVVGGYLGYVGYFCLAAGVELASNVEVCNKAVHAWADTLRRCKAITHFMYSAFARPATLLSCRIFTCWDEEQGHGCLSCTSSASLWSRYSCLLDGAAL